MKILVDAGVVQRDKRGSWAWYSLNAGTLAVIRRLLPGPLFLQNQPA